MIEDDAALDDHHIFKYHGCTTRPLIELKNWNQHKFKGSEPGNLPSTHPYWTIQVLLGDYKTRKKIIQNFKECKIDPEKVKFLFNGNTTSEDIQKRISNFDYCVKVLKYLNLIDTP